MNKQLTKIKAVYWIFSCLVLVSLFNAASVQAKELDIIVTVENLVPQGGVYFTPVWVGLHDGSYNLFDQGGLASEALERIAEDGDASALRMEFEAAAGGAAGGFDEVITAPAGFGGAPVFDPGDSASIELKVDSMSNRYMSFVSMIIPSNDAFIGNSKPKAVELFDAAGNFKGKKIITILGSMVWDAGTELNTEMDAAFINQTDANTGVTTVCPIGPHPGYLGSFANAGSDPVILGGTGPADIQFDQTAADFSLPYAVIARITIEAAPADQPMMMATAKSAPAGRTIQLASKPDTLPGRGNGRRNGTLGTVYVTSQGLYYDTFVSADSLPYRGRFQKLEDGVTEFGPGDPGYLGGRWWIDANGNGEMDPPGEDGDVYLLCPLLPPGREMP